MRQRPLPCKYCMAEPMSSSISFATWCSVIVRLSFVDDAVLGFLGWVPPLPLAWTQSLTPCKDKRTRGSTVREERVESEKVDTRATFGLSFCGDWEFQNWLISVWAKANK
jgi:hypothetical protein